MSNRALIGGGVIAMLIGCRAAEHPGPPRTEPRVPPDEAAASASRPLGDAGVPLDAAPSPESCAPGTVFQCDDKQNCTCGNGTGVYAAEGGFAGITVRMREGSTEQSVMITHFINNALGRSGPNVTFEYGYFIQPTKQWMSIGIGNVDSADYGGKNYPIVNSVRETNTVPTWELGAPGSSLLKVSDLDLKGLQLNISFPAGGGLAQKKVTLSFDSMNTNGVPPPTGNVTQTINKYNMQWINHTDYSGMSPQQYCHGPRQKPDMAVFQEGIDVEPLTGNVKRSGKFVTVSCSLGAPAIVYSWGYPYQGTDPDTFYFDAGIHMKRASYCGDSAYYTVAGTNITIGDSKIVHHGITRSNFQNLEAWWDRKGAVCVNTENMRHPEMAPTDIKLMTCSNQPYQGQSLKNCTFLCKSTPVPPCPPKPEPSPFLKDAH